MNNIGTNYGNTVSDKLKLFRKLEQYGAVSPKRYTLDDSIDELVAMRDMMLESMESKKVTFESKTASEDLKAFMFIAFKSGLELFTENIIWYKYVESDRPEQCSVCKWGSAPSPRTP